MNMKLKNLKSTNHSINFLYHFLKKEYFKVKFKEIITNSPQEFLLLTISTNQRDQSKL
jgi:hypothetical protein